MWLILSVIVIVVAFLYYIIQQPNNEDRTEYTENVDSKTDQSKVTLHTIIVRIYTIDILCQVEVDENALVHDLIIDVCKQMELPASPNDYYLTLDGHKLDINDTIKKSGLLDSINLSIPNFPELKNQEEENDEERNEIEKFILLEQRRLSKLLALIKEKNINSSTYKINEHRNTLMYPCTALYIDNLSPVITETMLLDKFSIAGPILSTRICRDMITRWSLGYAYVNFQQLADAERAFDTMNFDLLHNRPMRIMCLEGVFAPYKSLVGYIFIKNLDKNINDKCIYDVFLTFGTILSCKVMTDDHGQSKGFGFIQFSTKEAADHAIIKVNNVLLGDNDKKVHIDHFIPRRVCTGANEPKSRKLTNIFIGNFGDKLNENKLNGLLSRYGKITSCKIEFDENGKSKGFGFCSYENPEEAEAAVQNLNEHTIGDKQLYVGYFQKKNERLNKYQDVNLYIKNLDNTIDDERLRKEFSKFGTITSAKVMYEYDRSKGFGFVCFSAPDEATKAIAEMNGSIIGSKPIYVGLAQRRVERPVNLTNEPIQHIQTPRVPFHNGMGGTMSYLRAPLGPSQPRNFYPRAEPRWASTTAAAGMRSQANSPIIGKKQL